MNFVLAFIAFNFIVIVHELGHFIAAKKSGIKVLEFSLFIGPKIFGIKHRETEYSLRLFPVMAFVKLEGEEEASASESAYRNKPKHVRAIVAAAAPIANLLTAVVILTVVFSIMGFTTTGVEAVKPSGAAYNAGIKPGDIVVRYDGKSTLLPMDVVQYMYINNGRPVDIVIKRGNELIKKEIAPTLIPAHKRYLLGITVANYTGPDSNVVMQLMKGGAAEKAGLMVGDRIIGLNDRKISAKNDIDEFLRQNGDKPVKVTVLRNNEPVELNLTPLAEDIPEQYDLGIDFSFKRGNVWETFAHSLKYTISVVKSVFYSIVLLVTGKASLNQMMGPVGIVSTIGNVVQQGSTLSTQLLYLLQITAFFSIAVGAIQFVPFPMLDGNKLLLVIIEAIRGKPIPAEREAFISMIGFVILIMFSIYAFYNDILRIVGSG